MTIPKLTPYTGQVANPDGSQTQTEFTQNMFDQLSYEAQLATQLDATIDGMNNAVDEVEANAINAENSANAAEAAASSAGYQGLWPDTGGSALKGETWQTQVGGVPTGEYYTALQDTSVDPVWDNVNWKRNSDLNTGNLSDYTDIVYDTVSDMVLNSKLSNVNGLVRTKGYYEIGDGGGAYYIKLGAGTPIELDGMKIIHHLDADGNIFQLQSGDEINYLQAGGVGDWDASTLTGTDNTPILQNLIDYLFPFEWKGSVADTNVELKTFTKSILIPTPKSKYMLGDTVMLNPNTSMIGPEINRTFRMSLDSSEAVGAFFVPNFGSGVQEFKYCFDSAPYNSSGVRETSTAIAFTNADGDTGVYTRVPGVRMENILVCADSRTVDQDTGDAPFSPLRLFGQSHSIINCYTGQFLHGPSLQACWDYDFDRNLMQTFDSAISIYEGTVGNIGGINYCNMVGTRVRTGKALPPFWPTKDDGVFTDGDYDLPSAIVAKKVTSGRFKVGTWISERFNRVLIAEAASLDIEMLHSESIDASLLALKDSRVSINNGHTFQPSNRLYKPTCRVDNSFVEFSDFNFGCCGPMAPFIINNSEINIRYGCRAVDAADGTPNQGIIQTTPFTTRRNGKPSIYYEEFENRATRQIYVNTSGSGLGDDSYYGFDDNSAMKTVAEAITRVRRGDNVIIKNRNASGANTSEVDLGVKSLVDASATVENRYPNRRHEIRSTIYLKNSSLTIDDGQTFRSASPFQISGNVSLIMNGSSAIDVTDEVFSCPSNESAFLKLMQNNTSQFTSSGAFSDDSNIMAGYVNASTSSTQPAGGWGANTKVL